VETFGRGVGEESTAAGGHAPATLAEAAARGNEDVFFDMVGEGAQEFVGSAVGHGCAGEFLMQPFDGHSDRMRRSGGNAFCSREILALKDVDIFQLAQGFSFYRFDLLGVIEERFEFELLEEETPGGFGVVEGEGAFLDEFGGIGWRAVAKGANFQRQREAVKRVQRWIQKEVCDVGHALVVFEDGAPAIEGELPKAEAAPKRMDWGISGLLDCWGSSRAME
jgi:hypothetical protein